MAIAEGKMISLEELKNLVRARLTEAPSLRQLAPKLDASPATVSQLLTKASVKPGPRLLKALGYKAVTVYQKVSK